MTEDSEMSDAIVDFQQNPQASGLRPSKKSGRQMARSGDGGRSIDPNRPPLTSIDKMDLF